MLTRPETSRQPAIWKSSMPCRFSGSHYWKSRMPDLLHMPACPSAVRIADRPEALWEITHKDQNGKVLSEASI